MEKWAAIDIQSGRVVTLEQGEPGRATVWKDKPGAAARRWEEEGADGLHVIDLDAVFGTGSNLPIVAEIAKGSGIPVQVGGGIRSAEAAGDRLKMGARRVILGTLAYREPQVLSKLLKEWGTDRIVVAADHRDGLLVTKGWTQGEGVGVGEALGRFERDGVRTALVTSVRTDGMAAGPDLTNLRRICASTKLEILASGGIRDPGDVADIGRAGAHGVVLGRALYEGRLRMGESKRVT